METLFKKTSQSIFFNNNQKAIQRMLDYDYICRREKPSVAVIIQPTAQSSLQKFFFGPKEIVIPIVKTIEEAFESYSHCDTFLNFASFRSAYEITLSAINNGNIKTIMVTAEGIPERHARTLVAKAKIAKKILIGPATVGAITAGAFKTANIGGSIDNIVKSKLHREGSAGLATRSGGLFNELANIVARNADGIAEGVAIGGDRYPGSTFIDHILRMQKNPKVKYIVLLGEVGGTDEYEVIDAISAGKITKPIVAWCSGTVAEHLSTNVQFGHAGAKANAKNETAAAKNEALKRAGCMVPNSFNELPLLIKETFDKLSDEEESIIEVPEIPEDYIIAKKSGKIRKQTNFICTISDDRGEEAVYAGYPISQVATPETGFNIADVITLLWFKKRYPKWASDFIETVIKTVADHGPAVSGAHNARVTSRAGKDIVDSLVSGLLTIGPRFGGAIDGAAKHFNDANDRNLSPEEFVTEMKQKRIPIPGIGHRIKSLSNPDLRVKSLIDYANQVFPQTKLLDYAKKVEQVTTSKKENLILNVDGTVGVLLVDMWKSLNYTTEEINAFIESGTLNAFFVLGRSIGFIGHALDEKRLNLPLYRHEFDDILYDVSEAEVLV